MKSLFLVVTLALVIMSALLHWTAPDRASPVPVLYWVTQDDEVKRETIELFKQWLHDHGHPPVDVRLDNSNSDQTKKITQGLAGVGADLFDVYPFQKDLFSSSGMFLDVTDVAKERGFSPEASYPALKQEILFEGRQYGFPRNTGGAVFWLNTETFARYGIPEPSFRWTWDEFEKLGTAFVTAANPPGTRNRSYFVQSVPLIMLRRSLGLSIFNETMTKATLDDPRNAELMRRYLRWVNELHLMPTVAEQTAMAASSSRPGDGFFYLFATGRYAMLNLPRWALIRLRPLGKLSMRIVEPFHGGFPNMDFSCGLISVYAASKHPEAATRFLEFLASERFNLLVARSGDSLPPIPKYVQSEAFLRPPDHPEEWAIQEAFSKMGPELGIGYSRSPFVALGTVFRVESKISQAVVAGRLSPEEAGRQEEEELNAEIALTIRVDEKMRQRHEALTKIQVQIDQRRALGQKVPLAWITNPFYRVYYQAQGWLEEAPAS